jgi:hypothetical protein
MLACGFACVLVVQVGWSAPLELTGALKKHYHPKKSCAETKYQDALVKTGMTYR